MCLLSGVLFAQVDFWRHAGLSNRTILSLAVDPRGGILAGTGSDGVYRSSDGGETWTKLGGPASRADVIAVCRDSSIVVGSSLGRMVRSTDGGTTWSPTSITTLWVYSILVREAGDVFAGVFDPYDSLGGAIYKSSDHGNSWNRSSMGIDSALIRGLALSPGGKLFAGSLVLKMYIDKPSPNQWDFSGGMYKSVDDGQQWARSGLNGTSVSSIIVASDGSILAGSHNRGVHRSVDSGMSWTESNTGLTNEYQRNVRSMLALSNSQIWATTLGGVFYSTDGGNQWLRQHAGLADTSVLCIAVDSSGFLYVGTYGGIFRSVRSVTGMNDKNDGGQWSFSLKGIYPNPFNATTTIEFTLPEGLLTTLTIYNSLGQEVASILSESLSGGLHTRQWDAANQPSGVYFLRIVAGSFYDAKKMILVR